MINANELRIGNLLFWSTNNDIVVVDHEHIRMCLLHQNDFNKLYKPIPLTEEWWVKLGFEISWNIRHKKEYFNLFKVDDEYFYTADEHHHTSIAILYAHSLQNLYFALTGKEL